MTTPVHRRGARVVSGLSLVATGLFVVGPAAAYFVWLPPAGGFLLFSLGGLLAVGLTLAAVALAVILPSWRSLAAWCGTFPAVAVALVFFVLVAGIATRPPINDITTDVEQPPAFVAAAALSANRGRDMNYPTEAFAAVQQMAYPDLGPLHVAQPAPVVFARVRALSVSMPGWHITATDSDALRLEGVEVSRVFHFRDDFVIEVRALGESASAVHMRSKSRDGRGDLGANAVHIRSFLARLQAAIQS